MTNTKATPSPAPMVEQAGEIIQADRDAAADYWLAAFRHDSANLDAQFIREGRQDSKPLVQAFARHRLNTRPAPAETEGLPLMSEAFRTTTSGDGRYVMEFKFPTLAALHAADDEWIAFRKDKQCQDGFAASADGSTGAGTNATATVTAPTPPADAGVLREDELRRAIAAGLGLEPPFHDIGRPQQLVRIERMLTQIRAALNSQAHQIREGDHG